MHSTSSSLRLNWTQEKCNCEQHACASYGAGGRWNGTCAAVQLEKIIKIIGIEVVNKVHKPEVWIPLQHLTLSHITIPT